MGGRTRPSRLSRGIRRLRQGAAGGARRLERFRRQDGRTLWMVLGLLAVRPRFRSVRLARAALESAPPRRFDALTPRGAAARLLRGDAAVGAGVAAFAGKEARHAAERDCSSCALRRFWPWPRQCRRRRVRFWPSLRSRIETG